MKDINLSHPTPYGDRISYNQVTETLRDTLEKTEMAYANHLYTKENDVRHLMPGPLASPESTDELSVLGKCETCTNAKRIIAMITEQLQAIKINFMVEAIREEERNAKSN